MKTGVVLRKRRWIGGKDGHEITEYEINTALIESLNSVERRAAIETGQEVDRVWSKNSCSIWTREDNLGHDRQ